MENRFLELDDYRHQLVGKRCLRGHNEGTNGAVASPSGAARVATSQSSAWVQTFSAQDRALVILIENGGVDLGIPTLVDKLLEAVPVATMIPTSVRKMLVEKLSEKIRSVTDNLLESAELALNRYNAAKPALFGNVTTLRDGTSSYGDLKKILIALSKGGKIVDLFVLTHGSSDFISVPGGIDGQKIRDIKTENGKPLSIRSVYMMNCVGSSLNQAWIDAGAKVSAGALRNNYLPEPTMFFFWKNWQAAQTFENAVTSAYRKTINLMNETVRTLVSQLPSGDLLASSLDFENLSFVKDSAPVIQGQRSVSINSDDLSSSQSVSSSLATTVLPVRLLRSFGVSQSENGSSEAPRSASPQGLEFLKSWEGLHSNLSSDPTGYCVIGYGTRLHAGSCDGRPSEQPYSNGISKEAATQLLVKRADELQSLIADAVKVELNQNQYAALVSFIYDVGGDGFQRSKLLRLLNQGDYGAAVSELKKWTRARQNGQIVDVPELVKRRAAEAQLFQKLNDTTSRSPSAGVPGHRAQSLSAIDYVIPGTLPVIAQPSPYTCWAAVFTMMYSWKTNSSVEIRQALARIGSKYVDMFNRDVPLDSDSAKALYNAARLVPLTSFNSTVDGWASLLRKYGPLYIDVGYNAQNAGTHAIIVTGISGDGSTENTSIVYVDPDGGKTITLKFRDFISKYEAQSAVEWPYTIVHWPAGSQTSMANSFSITNSYEFHSPSFVMQQSGYSTAQNPAAAVIAGMEVADAAQIGLAAVAIVQAQVSASQGSFSLSYDKAQRLLTTEARAQMPGAQSSKKSYSQHLFSLSIGRINSAEADVIIEWEGNAYGEIGTPIIRRNLATSTEWSKSSANITITKVDRIPLPQTDPRTWPIIYSYEGTYDPWGNGYYEFSGEFEINAFGGLKFNRHEVASRSLAEWAIQGDPQERVQRGHGSIVPVPVIPQEQINYLRTKLP